MSEKKTVLITGSNGLLGQALVKRFSRDFNVCGCDLSDENINSDVASMDYHRLDLTRRESVQEYFSRNKPDVIINTAAFTDVDRSEEKQSECWAINVKAVEFLLEALQVYSPVFCQISTDYVFNGQRGHYKETDQTSPISHYGRTKLAAEKIVRQSRLNYIIARTQILYGWGKNIRNNFATWVIRELQNNNSIKVVNDQMGNPTYVDDLAIALLRLIIKREYGLYHIAGNEICSRLEFARKIAEIFGLNMSLIKQTTTSALQQKAPRPMNSSFILDKLYNALDWLPGNVEQSLRMMNPGQDQRHE